jgi:hypothetical protein
VDPGFLENVTPLREARSQMTSLTTGGTVHFVLKTLLVGRMRSSEYFSAALYNIRCTNLKTNLRIKFF